MLAGHPLAGYDAVREAGGRSAVTFGHLSAFN